MVGGTFHIPVCAPEQLAASSSGVVSAGRGQRVVQDVVLLWVNVSLLFVDAYDLYLAYTKSKIRI